MKIYKHKGVPDIILTVLNRASEVGLKTLLKEVMEESQTRFSDSNYDVKHYTAISLGRLVDRGLITKAVHGGEAVFRLSLSGKERLKSIYKPVGDRRDEWDGKWRVVIFDIKESKRSRRDALRRGLRARNFIQLQRSVWVSPHDNYEYVALLKTSLGSAASVLYMVTDKLENSDVLIKSFGLKEK
ncbi:MAG: hypothetical protein WC797_03545 [Candidatus Paceibacterota bacterium]|jgi:phenylacetic acid degradation operon negative regulatory protein